MNTVLWIDLWPECIFTPIIWSRLHAWRVKGVWKLGNALESRTPLMICIIFNLFHGLSPRVPTGTDHRKGWRSALSSSSWRKKSVTPTPSWTTRSGSASSLSSRLRWEYLRQLIPCLCVWIWMHVTSLSLIWTGEGRRWRWGHVYRWDVLHGLRIWSSTHCRLGHGHRPPHHVPHWLQ